MSQLKNGYTVGRHHATVRCAVSGLARRARLIGPIVLAAASFPAFSQDGDKAAAESYPSRPITFVVPSPAGGTTDVVARILARKLSDKLGQPVVVDNRAGANGYIGTTYVLRGPKDGYRYTVMSGSLHSFTPAMVKSMPFDAIEDFALVSRLIEYPFMLVTSKDSPYNNLPDLIKAGKAANAKLSYGSYGVGSSPHLITELLKLKTGVSAVHVPYKGGGQSSADLIGGQISFMFSSLPAATAQVNGGQVKALAITSARRHPAFPDVAAVAETLPGFESTSWLGLAAAKGTPSYAVDKMRAAVLEVSKDPDYIAQMRKLSAEVKVDESAAAFHRFLTSEKAKWDGVVATAKIPKQDE